MTLIRLLSGRRECPTRRAAFTAIALTDHLMDEFLEDAHTPEMLGWHEEHNGESSGREHALVLQADWRVRAAALEQGRAARGEHM